MLTRMKSAMANLVGGIMSGSSGSEPSGGLDLPPRFPYGRPEFLGLSQDEVECSADHIARPILILKKETECLPWTTGYAEVINAGKSTHNEDQASCEVLMVKKKMGTTNSTPNRNSSSKRRSSLPNGEGLQLKENSELDSISFHYWSLFDGHAGSGAAVVASKLLQHHIVEQLQEIVDILKNSAVPPPTCLGEEPESMNANSRMLTRAASLRGSVGAPGSPGTPSTRFFTEKKISQECLVIGAVETAFREMDLQIERERTVFNISGGCTALVVVYLLGKLYVANAGDSRAIIIRNGEVIPMSSEFTPETERQRLQYLAYMQPHLLGNEFTHLEFPRRVQRKEVGKRMLYRDFSMIGWAYKTIEEDDLKFPLIYGEGKKARVMATIGVTRGLGDHDLKVHDSTIYIKPFLSSSPEVRVYDLLQYEHGSDDVLILATDGLWDVLLNEEVAEAITNFLPNCDPDDPHRPVLHGCSMVCCNFNDEMQSTYRKACEMVNDTTLSPSNYSELVIPRQQTLQDTPLLDSCGNRHGQKASADFSDLDCNRDYELSQRPRYLPCELKSCNLCKDWFACDCGRDLWGSDGSEYYKIVLSSDSDSGDEGYFSDGRAVHPLNSV